MARCIASRGKSACSMPAASAAWRRAIAACFCRNRTPADAAPNCSEAGVLGVLPGVIGLLQATEAIELVLGIGQPLQGRLLQFDALAMRFAKARLRRTPACPVCARSSVPGYADYAAFYAGA